MPSAAIKGGLADFQTLLIGTWRNQALPNATNGEGSSSNPLGYSVMPLPATEQVSCSGYILKNHSIYEDVTFDGPTSDMNPVPSPPPTTAPNRGNNVAQLPTALYYQQQVFFGEGQAQGTVVHTENGSWLNLATGEALDNPYSPLVLQVPNQQPSNRTVGKQISVPHGNSVLALGSASQAVCGAPTIPNSESTLPSDSSIDTSQYMETLNMPDNYQNPNPAWTLNPNKPLQTAVGLIRPNEYRRWQVTTKDQGGGTKGGLLNIPFEQSWAEVTDYTADYWLMSTDNGGSYNYLAYSQVITLSLSVKGQSISFPHVTTNVVTKLSN